MGETIQEKCRMKFLPLILVLQVTAVGAVPLNDLSPEENHVVFAQVSINTIVFIELDFFFFIALTSFILKSTS